MTRRRVLFVTGTLAEKSLRRTLDAIAPPFEYRVAVLGMTVAALMTTTWIARHLVVEEEFDSVVIPGLCRGSADLVSAAVGIPTEKGPVDLRDLPRHLGFLDSGIPYGEYDIDIVAEINNAPRLPRDELLVHARRLVEHGADYVDLGMMPGSTWEQLDWAVRDLVAAGVQVSVDTFDPIEITAAVNAGASLVLSVNGSNLDVAHAARDAGARVVVVPDSHGDMDSLHRNVEKLHSWGVPYLVDPIVDPIGHGFFASLQRFADARRRYPDAEMLFGAWNITELTAADSTGINAILVAICQEIGIRTVLTTEDNSWACGSVQEIDVARRLMRYSVDNQLTPVQVDERLVTARDTHVLRYTDSELREMHNDVRDRNFRIFTCGETIVAFNATKFVRGDDIQEIFDQLEVDDPRHAFYLGRELMKARIAVTLGKNFRQEGEFDWGYIHGSGEAVPRGGSPG